MRKSTFIVMLIGATLLAACGSAATPAASSKPVNIKMETNPNPAAMGDIELLFTITDANAVPIDGATVDVSADHTDMTGMNMNGAATEQSAGKYSIKANFSMSGSWKLNVHVSKIGLDYSEEITLPVQ